MYRALVTCHHLQRYFEDFQPHYEASGVEPILPTIEGQQLDAAAMREVILDVDAVIAGDDEIDASVLEAGKASRLKAVIKWGIGTDSIDKAKAAELGIPVFNTPGTFANEVADLAISLLLNVLRQTHHMHNSVKQGGWRKVPGRSLAGKTAGVIGLGSIGQAVARRTVAFGMNTIGYDVRAIDADTVTDALGVLHQWAEGVSWQEVSLPGKNTVAVCHDIRAYYTEAALELATGPAPGGRAVDAWFHEETEAGKTVLAARAALKEQDAPFPFWFYMAPAHR